MIVRARDVALAALLATPLVGGCDSDGARPEWASSADTVAGVVHVANTPPTTGPLPTLVAAEDFRIGTLEDSGPTSFGLLRSIAVLDDGGFAVGDGLAQEVRVFDRDGRHLRTFGGEGAGPGELQGMQGVFTDHEGLLRVAEQGNARLSVFHPDSGFVTSFPLQLFSYGFLGPWPAAIDSSGRTHVASSGQFGAGRFWNMVRVYDPLMNQIDSIPYHDYTDDIERDQPGAWRITVGNGFMWAPVPFYPRPHQLITRSGELWTTAEGAAELEVTRWSPGGDTSLVLSSFRPLQPVSAADRDSAMAELRARLEERLPSVPSLGGSRVPATKPPAYGLSLDDRDRLWVRVTDSAADSTIYDVFNRDGGYAETVSLRFRVDVAIPPVVRGDTLWAVATDDLEVQYVVRATLRPPGYPETP